ncbi:MAG TPA: hypothetical protein VFS00_00545, partial [Polyangiaceae bacterium]|nr:hypothetical protein [Polyangiaceae bacterium]
MSAGVSPAHARELLGADELAALLAPGGARPGFEASLALARYIALALGADGSLRQHLELDRAAWVPTAEATLRPPSALFWPEPGLDELLGPRPDVLPHPLFARTVPPAFGRRLRFRRAADASLDDVLRPLVDGEAAPVETLRWFEEALRAGSLEPAALRRGLGARRVLLDARGEARAFAELGTGLDERPVWADHERWPKLSAALRLDRRPAAGAAARPANEPAASKAPAASNAPDLPAAPDEPAPKPSLWQRWFGGLTKSPTAAPEPPDFDASESAITSPPPPPRPPPPASPREAPAASPRRASASSPFRQAPAALPPESSASWSARQASAWSPPRGGGEAAEVSPELLKRRAEHEAWYRPSDAIRPQLDRAGGWSESRRQRPRYGFALAPGKLPPPYLYAPRTLADRFHAPTQRWERGDL